MVITYLENIYSDLMERKIKLEQQQNDIISKMNDHQKFVERLIEEDEENFDAFSPRKQNVDLKNQIDLLKKEQKDFLKSVDGKKKEILDVNAKIDELNSVLKVAKQQSAANEKVYEHIIDEKEIIKLKQLEILELERQRIARELHDSSVQSLTSLIHKTELCTKLIDMDPLRCRLEMSSLSATLKNVIEEMRQMIYDLHPMSIDDIGFDVLIEQELFKINQLGIVCTNFSVEGKPYQLKPVIAMTLHRVIREACNNVLKHADASVLSVKLYYKKDQVQIIISDDGKGFSLEEKAGKIKNGHSGFGLSIMNEQMFFLSGDMEINTENGKGTRITLKVPMSVERSNICQKQ